MKRTLPAVLFPLVFAPAHAQLLNGSFEDSNGFSLAGWEWTCGTPIGGNDVPAGAGDWSARKELGSPTCSPSFLFQRIPFVQSGTHWILSGWVRADETGWNSLPRLGLGSLNDGAFTTQNWIGSPALEWNFCWINDTAHATATDTAVVVLTCGTDFMGAGWFDGIQLEPAIPTGMGEQPVRIHIYLDAEQVLHLSAGDLAIRAVQVFDAAGRAVHADVRIAPGSAALRTTDWNTGLYMVRTSTSGGSVTTRFVKP